MISTKNYIIIHNSDNTYLYFGNNKGATISTPTSNTIFESDKLQECIEYLLENNINTFPIPIILTGLKIDNIKKNPVFDNVLTSYENGIPVYSVTLVGYTEETNQDIILERKVNLLSWKYPNRTIRITGDISLFTTGGDYAAFINQLYIRQTPIESIDDNTSAIYFEWVEKLDGLFSLDETLQIINCADSRLTLEQLYDSGYKQNDVKIYR